MKNSLISVADRILLRKRALIEAVNDELENIVQIEHSRHRSFNNFIANALTAIAAFCFFEKKPAIDLQFVNDGQQRLFELYRNHVKIADKIILEVTEVVKEWKELAVWLGISKREMDMFA